jgi:purine-binding chemotaxis protein CheW
MAEASKPTEPFILFELAGTMYGVRSRLVQQIEMIEQVTPVPNAPEYVDGVVFSRGQVIPMLNLRVRFGFPRTPIDLRTRLVIVNVDGRTVGLIVDTSREFLSIPAEAIQPPPDGISGLSGKYIEGIATLNKRIIIILELSEVLRSTETIMLAASESA